MLYIVDTGSESSLQMIAASTLCSPRFALLLMIRLFTCFVLQLTEIWMRGGLAHRPLCSRGVFAAAGRGSQVTSDSGWIQVFCTCRGFWCPPSAWIGECWKVPFVGKSWCCYWLLMKVTFNTNENMKWWIYAKGTAYLLNSSPLGTRSTHWGN